MVLLRERVGKLIETIGEMIYEEKIPVREYRMKKTDGRELNPEGLDVSDWEVMTNRQIWGGHRETVLTDSAEPGEKFCILLSAFTGDNNFSLLLDSEIKVTAEEIYQYYWDVRVPYEAASLQPADSDDRIVTIQALNESLNLVDLRRPYSEAFYQSIEKAEQYLQENYYEKYCGNSKHTVYAVGHTHIDLAWLWTLRTTADKTVRSFSTVLELMRRYPEYKFMHTQPQEYRYVKNNAPEIYEQVKQRVEEGRWQPEGGMWVEADCNLTSGESLVRQFLYGCRFFQKEFNKKCEILWLPDVVRKPNTLLHIMA